MSTYTSSYNYQQTLSNLNSKNYLFLFLVWPFWAFVFAMMNYSQKDAKKVVYWFLVYYGLTFVVDIEGSFADSSRYAMNFVRTANLPFSDFFKILSGLNSEEQKSLDILQSFLTFVISRFTSDYRFLFAAFAAFFGFFYLKSFNLLHDRYSQNPGWGSMFHMAFFLWIIPITYITGFRMWAAAWVFFYGAYHVILYRKPKYFLLTLGACLVHWSFITTNFLLVVYFFLGNRNVIYLPLAIASFILPKLLMSHFQTIADVFGGAVQNRYENYTSEGYGNALQASVQQASWFVQLYQMLLNYYILIAVGFIKIKFKRLMSGKPEKNLFSFLLLFLTFTNFGAVIPSFGRFRLVFYLFGILYIFLFYTKIREDKPSLWTLASVFPLFLYVAVAFRMGSDSINVWLLAPGLGSPLLAPAISVSELLF